MRSIKQVTLVLSFIVGLVGLAITFTKISYAQSCSSTITCCQRRETVATPRGCSDSCDPRDTGCVRCSYEDRCVEEGGTVSCRVSGSGCVQDAACPAGTLSGSCVYSAPPPPPTTVPTASPPSGGSCGGGSNPECITGSNCGVAGKVPGTGSCSAGQICCVDGGGGGGTPDSCRILDMAPLTVEVGQTIRVNIDVQFYEDWTGSNTKLEEINVGPTGVIWANRNATAFDSPTYIQTAEISSGTRPYIRGIAVGTDTVRVEQEVERPGDSSECSDEFTITVTTPPPWAQISDGSLITLGRVRVQVPPGQYLVNSGRSDEGIVTYNPTLNTTGGQISPSRWRANVTDISQPHTYAEMIERIPSGVTVNTVGGAFNDLSLASGLVNRDSLGYEWYSRTGNVNIPGLNILSGRKVILFVDGNVRIGGRITMPNPKTSFFMIVATGDIEVRNALGTIATDTTPLITGILVSEGQFITNQIPGAGNLEDRVNIYGSVIALGGVSLARETETADPSETFTFSPELMLNYPPALMVKRAFWKEVAP